MNDRSPAGRLGVLDRLNFALTHRVPRALLTRLMGRFSRIRQPLVRDLSIALWQRFGDLDLRDARKSRFDSVHDCFTRELRPGARPIDADPDVLTSPCDAIVGACGPVFGTEVFQAKGLSYPLAELLHDEALARYYGDGCYATLRLTAGMYHRFHAPHDCTVEQVTCVPGDVYNVNPPAVALIERLYCRNERAVIRCRLRRGAEAVTLVPVAAILVAGIRLHFIDLLLHLGYRGVQTIRCSARLAKGAEMGWFEHGSTLLVFAPRGFALGDGIAAGARIRMGQRLMKRVDD
jgi:phosphatidylserine decarboxylase